MSLLSSMTAAGSIALRVRFLATSFFAAYAAFALLVVVYGESPRTLLALMYEGTWGSSYGVGQVIFKATPLLMMGLSVDVALRAGLFNIGAEGQLAVASLALALAGHLMNGVPALIALPVILIVACVAGALFAMPAAWLKSRANVHEVLTFLLLNRIAEPLVTWLLASGLARPGTVRTEDVAASARILRLDSLVPALRGSAASLAVLLPLLLLVLRPLAWSRTVWGREIMLVGQGPLACRAAGIPVAKHLMLATAISGALAGLAGSATVLGYKGYYEQGLGAGAGFLGLAVAMMGRGGAVELVFAALLFGTLSQGGLAINARVPRDVMDVVTALTVLAVAYASRMHGARNSRAAEARI